MLDAELVERAFAAFARGDLGAVGELLDPDVRWLHWDPGPWDCYGRAAVLGRLQAQQGFAGTASVEQGPEKVLVRVSDEHFGACMVITLRHGRIIGLRDHQDEQQARIDAGLLDYAPPPPAGVADVSDLVPFVHVSDVAASARFYAHLGFEIDSRHEPAGRLDWCFLRSPAGAKLMLARASAPVERSQQAVLFYLYSDDLAGLRERLVQAGLRPSPIFDGSPGPAYELRIADPDGYVLMVAQSSTK